jgi:hypothetical protein
VLGLEAEEELVVVAAVVECVGALAIDVVDDE